MKSWRSDKRKTAERGYGWEWQKARSAFLARNPLCVMCLPKVIQATVVDHKIPHKGDQTLFWDQSNWQALCKPHHDGEKKLIEHGKEIVTIGADGWPS